MVGALLAAHQERLDEKVAAGDLTQEQADERFPAAEERVTAILDGVLPLRRGPGGHGRGMHGHPASVAVHRTTPAPDARARSPREGAKQSACNCLPSAASGSASSMERSKNLLMTELNALLRLTQTEATIAHARRGQARSGRVAEELAENAENCDERALLLAEAIRDLGGVPDVVGSVTGRLSAAAKLLVEQGQPISDALLGDLALEHQLLDRTRFARVLADEAGEKDVIDVLDRLETAHAATIDWIMTRLSEVAVGGPSAMQPSPTQVLAGAARRVAVLPMTAFTAVMNRSFDAVDQLQDRAEETVETTADRVGEIVSAASEIWTAGRNASLGRSEKIARQNGNRSTARKVHRLRSAAGALDASELPIKNYDDLNADVAVGRIEKLNDVDDVRAVLAYETANKQRKGVLRAAEARFEEITSNLIAAS